MRADANDGPCRSILEPNACDSVALARKLGKRGAVFGYSRYVAAANPAAWRRAGIIHHRLIAGTAFLRLGTYTRQLMLPEPGSCERELKLIPLYPGPCHMRIRPLPSAAAAGRQIENQRAVAAGLPYAQVCEQRRQSSARPQQHEIEKTRGPRTEQQAYTVNRCAEQHSQQILCQQEGLHRRYHVEQQRRIGHTPPHGRPRRADEQRIGDESGISSAHDCLLDAEQAASPGHYLRRPEADPNPQNRADTPPP